MEDIIFIQDIQFDDTIVYCEPAFDVEVSENDVEAKREDEENDDDDDEEDEEDENEEDISDNENSIDDISEDQDIKSESDSDHFFEEIPAPKPKVQRAKPGQFKCGGCPNSYATKAALTKHLKDFHKWSPDPEKPEPKSKTPVKAPANKKSKLSKTPPNTFEFKFQLDSLINPKMPVSKPRVRGEPKFLCEMCSKRCYTEQTLKKHIRDVHENENDEEGGEPRPAKKLESVECWVCQKVVSKAHLRHHIQRTHLNFRPYKCTSCPKAFFSSSCLRVHNKSVHEKIRDHICPICSKGLSSKEILAQHISSVHEKGKPYACNQCDATFRWIGQKQMHKWKEHGAKEPKKRPSRAKTPGGRKGRAPSEPEGTEILAPVCPYCNLSFHGEGPLQKHIKKEHETPKSHQCPHCTASFGSGTSLNRHINLEHKSNPGGGDGQKTECYICHKKYFNFYIQSHIEAVHLKAKKFPCQYCNAMMSHKGDVAKHIKYKHDQEAKKFQCAICSKAFFTESFLENHINAVHRNLRTFFCTECPKSFKWEGEVFSHYRKVHKHLAKRGQNSGTTPVKATAGRTTTVRVVEASMPLILE